MYHNLPCCQESPSRQRVRNWLSRPKTKLYINSRNLLQIEKNIPLTQRGSGINVDFVVVNSRSVGEPPAKVDEPVGIQLRN